MRAQPTALNRRFLRHSCGIVSARALTWARQGWPSLEKIGTSAELAVLQHANTDPAAAGQAKAHSLGTTHSEFLKKSAVTFLGQHYMQAEVGDFPSRLPLNDPNTTWPSQCTTSDYPLIGMAIKLVEAANMHPARRFLFCGNSEGTSSPGFHWISCILDIDANSPVGTAEKPMGLA